MHSQALALPHVSAYWRLGVDANRFLTQVFIRAPVDGVDMTRAAYKSTILLDGYSQPPGTDSAHWTDEAVLAEVTRYRAAGESLPAWLMNRVSVILADERRMARGHRPQSARGKRIACHNPMEPT
jgi:hypothetical protein